MSDAAASQDQRDTPSAEESNAGLVILVCVAGGLAGLLFGSFKTPIGSLIGLAGGVPAGLLWSWAMLRSARHGAGRGANIVAGTGWGVLVGLLATVILHGGLALWEHVVLDWAGSGPSEGILVVAVLCAIWAGAGTGAVCGCFVPVRRR